MRAALEQHPGQLVEIEDDETKRTYLLFDRQQARELLDQWIISELVTAEADVAAGRVVDWDAEYLMRTLHPR